MSISGYTSRYRLRKVSFASRGYHTDEWFNLDVIDGLLGAIEDASTLAFADTVGGTVDAITLDFSPNITYTAGQQISFVASGANTGAVTVNCDSLGAKALVRGSGTALSAGDLETNQYVKAVYDGTQFIVLYPDLDTIAALTRINSGDSGVTPDTSADEFIVESAGDGGASILVPNGQQARLLFGHVSAATAGGLHYDTTTGRLYFRAGNAEGAYFDSSKLLRQPDLPYFYADKHTTATIATPFTVTGYTEQVDSRTAFDPTTGLFTAPVTGIYQFTFTSHSYGSGSVLTSNYGFFYKNGAQVGPNVYFTGGGSNAVTAIFSLTAGDTIGFRFHQWGGTGVSMTIDAHFSGRLIT